MADLVKEKFVAAVIAAVVSTAVGALFAWISTKRSQKHKVIDDIHLKITGLEQTDLTFSTAIRSMLRQNIIDAYNRLTTRGYAKVFEKDNVKDMYDSYHDLGGNGTITHLVNEIMDLPTREGGTK